MLQNPSKPQIHTDHTWAKRIEQNFNHKSATESDKPTICQDLAQGLAMKGQMFEPDALLKQIKLIVRVESLKQTSLPSIESVLEEREELTLVCN